MEFKLEAALKGGTKLGLINYKAMLESGYEMLSHNETSELVYAGFMKTLDRHIESVDMALLELD